MCVSVCVCVCVCLCVPHISYILMLGCVPPCLRVCVLLASSNPSAFVMNHAADRFDPIQFDYSTRMHVKTRCMPYHHAVAGVASLQRSYVHIVLGPPPRKLSRHRRLLLAVFITEEETSQQPE